MVYCKTFVLLYLFSKIGCFFMLLCFFVLFCNDDIFVSRIHTILGFLLGIFTVLWVRSIDTDVDTDTI